MRVEGLEVNASGDWLEGHLLDRAAAKHERLHRRKPWLDRYAVGSTEFEFTGVFDDCTTHHRFQFCRQRRDAYPSAEPGGIELRRNRLVEINPQLAPVVQDVGRL